MASNARRGPFDRLRPVAAVAAGYAILAAVWVTFGRSLPGGRWLAVHFFTLGVVTNLILALSDHFSRTLTRQPGEVPPWGLVAVNAGAITVFVGVAAGHPWLVGTGAATLSAMVVTSSWRLHQLRRRALAPRFGWIVGMYERAHAAFLLGAVLGTLVGIGLLGGPWVVAARIAHLHVNVLGWAGVTLLATIVFFGPTIARARIREGADVRAARALRVGTVGLGVAVLGLLATGSDGSAGTVARAVAAFGLAAFAWSVTAVSVPVIRASWTSGAADRWSVLAVAAWFVPVAWSDVIVVAAGAWRLLDAVGAAMLLGVLAQAIAATIGYLAPRLFHLDPATGYARVDAGANLRAAAWNAGTALMVGAAIADASSAPGWAVLAWVGWAAVLIAAVARAVTVARAVASTDGR